MTGIVDVLLLRNINGKTVVSAYEAKTKRKKVSALQQRTRSTFAEASQYAKTVTRNPAKYEHYKKLAKKLGVSSAYTAAITDFMRKPKKEAVDTFKAAKRNEISVQVSKKGFPIASVKVTITTTDAHMIKQGIATKNSSNRHTFRHRGFPIKWKDTTITIEATDRVGNSVAHKQHLYIQDRLLLNNHLRRLI